MDPFVLCSLSIISDFDRKRILKAVLVDILMIVCGIAGHLGISIIFSGSVGDTSEGPHPPCLLRGFRKCGRFLA